MAKDLSVFCQVNTKDNAKEEGVAKKHVPVIEVPDKITAGEFFDVKICVGEVEHPNENEHFIEWVELYVGDIYLGRFDRAPVMTKASISIPVMLGHAGLDTCLRATVRCNLHGVWEGRVDVKPE